MLQETQNENIVKIARICHETNRAYCETIGDHSQKSWNDAEAHQRKSCIEGVTTALSNPLHTPESMHSNWMRSKIDDGWVHGDEKDASAKTHPCICPYSELPKEQRIKDYLFLAIVNVFRSEKDVSLSEESEHQ